MNLLPSRNREKTSAYAFLVMAMLTFVIFYVPAIRYKISGEPLSHALFVLWLVCFFVSWVAAVVAFGFNCRYRHVCTS